jgi:hypothetical protein
MLGISAATWTLLAGPGVAIITLLLLIGKFVLDARTAKNKPGLDLAQTSQAVAGSDQVRVEIERQSRALNASRDLWNIQLENWADKMRPAMRTRDDRIEILTDLVREDHAALSKPMPELPALEPWPEFPKPQAPAPA